MANQTVYPFGTDGQLPSGIGIINDLVTGGADKALAAQQGKVIGDYLFGPYTPVDLTGVTISSYSLGDNSTTNYKWGPNGLHFVIPVRPGEKYLLKVECETYTAALYGFLTSSYTPPASTSTPVPYVSGTDRVWASVGSTLVTVPDGAAYLCCCPRDGSSNVSTWTISKQGEPGINDDFVMRDEVEDWLGRLEEVDLEDYQQLNFNLETPSAWAASTTYKCILIPASDLADDLKFVADTYKFSFAFLKSNNAASGVAPDLCSGTSVTTITAGNELTASLPSDCNYLYVYVSSDYAYGKIHLYNILAESNVVTWDDLENLVIDSKKDKNVKIMAGTCLSNRFTLFHFSDLHKHADSLTKALAYRDKYSGYCNDTIFTGDLNDLYSDSIAWWTGADTSDILFVIGNHESQNRMAYELTNHIGLDVYNKFVKPFISGWGTLGKVSVSGGSLAYDSGNPSGANIFQPSTADELGQSYYFKDYTIGVRLVVLDWLNYDSTQKAWFEAVLADAKVKNLSVVVSSHFPSTPIVKSFNEFDAFDSVNVITDSSWLTLIPGYTAHEEIQDFIDGGGKFVCWVCGHTHRDAFGILQGYPDQMAIMITAAQSTVTATDLMMAGDTACNIFSVDLTAGCVYLNRIGAKDTFDARRRESLCWDYVNHKLVRQ